MTGALGAGKTRLLGRMLADEPVGRTGLVVNEFAKGGIDQILLGTVSVAPATLFGCLCCRDQGDIVRTLDQVRRDPRVQRIVVETSGLASANVLVGELLADPRFMQRYELGRVVTVVDASRGPETVAEGWSADQIGAADLVVLSHLDRLHPAMRPQAVHAMTAHLQTAAPDAEIKTADSPSGLLREAAFARRSRVPRVRRAPDEAAEAHGHPASESFTMQGYIASGMLEDVARSVAWFFPGLLRMKLLSGSSGGQPTGLINVTAGQVQGVELLNGVRLQESHVYLIGEAASVAAASDFLRGQMVDCDHAYAAPR